MSDSKFNAMVNARYAARKDLLWFVAQHLAHSASPTAKNVFVQEQNPIGSQ